MRTANPALNKKTFMDLPAGQGHMTIEGATNRSFILLMILLFFAGYIWNSMDLVITYPGVFIWGSLIGGFIVALVTIFKKEWSPVTAPIYAALEGLLLGAISSFMEQVFPGIVIQAVALTFGTFLMLLFAYKTKMIRVTQNFRLGVIAATGAIALIYIVTLVLNIFGTTIPYIHNNGILGIGFSLFVVVIASLNLVLDFDFIERAHGKAPKYMEWYAAFGLIVTLVWLYIEILRLLSKIRSR